MEAMIRPVGPIAVSLHFDGAVLFENGLAGRRVRCSTSDTLHDPARAWAGRSPLQPRAVDTARAAVSPRKGHSSEELELYAVANV